MTRPFVATLLWGVLAFVLAGAKAPDPKSTCRKNPLKGFDYVKSDKGMDTYVNKSTSLALTVKCEAASFDIGDVHQLVAPSFTLVKAANRTFYFDFNGAGVLGRTYYVPTKPVMQLSFVTSDKNKAALEGTQKLVEELATEP